MLPSTKHFILYFSFRSVMYTHCFVNLIVDVTKMVTALSKNHHFGMHEWCFDHIKLEYLCYLFVNFLLFSFSLPQSDSKLSLQQKELTISNLVPKAALKCNFLCSNNDH